MLGKRELRFRQAGIIYQFELILEVNTRYTTYSSAKTTKKASHIRSHSIAQRAIQHQKTIDRYRRENLRAKQ